MLHSPANTRSIACGSVHEVHAVIPEPLHLRFRGGLLEDESAKTGSVRMGVLRNGNAGACYDDGWMDGWITYIEPREWDGWMKGNFKQQSVVSTSRTAPSWGSLTSRDELWRIV